MINTGSSAKLERSGLVVRKNLPKPTDRLPLGASGLFVSPICLGLTQDAETVLVAFDAGINFFFVTGDLHWPRYEQLRRGLEQLLARRPSVRDQVVVAVVSYLDQPLFQALQFDEVIDSIPALQRVDVLVAGAIQNKFSLLGRPSEGEGRYQAIHQARAAGHNGARAIGASFHDRQAALLSLTRNLLDVNYIRYNASHLGAATEIFPHLRRRRTGLIFNFKSVLAHVSQERRKELGLHDKGWLPKVTDHYRFVLSNPNIDGILCSPANPVQLAELVAALDEPPLTPEEQDYLVSLSERGARRYF